MKKFETALLNPIDITVGIFILVAGLIFLMQASSKFKLTKQEVIAIYIWHSFFAFLFLSLDMRHGFDSVDWYLDRKMSFGISNSFMYTICYILDRLFIGYLGQNALFNILGSFSLLIIYHIIKNLSVNNNFFFKFSVLIILLPGFNLWSSGISKDTISIFALCLMIFSIVDKEKKWILFLLSTLTFSLVRPHLLLFSIIAGLFAFSYFIFFKKKNILILLIFLVLLMPLLFFLFKFSIYFVPYEGDLPMYAQKLMNFGEMLRNSYTATPLGIDYDTNLFFRIVYFLFKPFFIDIKDIYSFYFSVESFIIMIFFMSFFYQFFLMKNKFFLKKINNCFYLFISFFGIFALIIFSYFISNYGISLRQKWMFIPFFIIMFNYLLKDEKRKK
jgi:hypothetical protein